MDPMLLRASSNSCIDGQIIRCHRGRSYHHHQQQQQRHASCCQSNDSLVVSSSRISFIAMMMSWRMLIVILTLAPYFGKSMPISSSSSTTYSTSNYFNWWSWLCHDVAMVADALMIHQVNVVGIGSSSKPMTTSSALFSSTDSSSSNDANGNTFQLPFFRKHRDAEQQQQQHQLVVKLDNENAFATATDNTVSSSTSSSKLIHSNNSHHHQVGWLWWRRKQPLIGPTGNLNYGMSSTSSTATASSSSTAVAISLHRSNTQQHQRQQRPGARSIRIRRHTNSVVKLRRLILLPSMFMLSSAMTPLRRRLSRFGTQGIVKSASTSTTNSNTAVKKQKKIKRMVADRTATSTIRSQHHPRSQLQFYGPHPPPPLLQFRRHVTNAASSANTNVATLFSRAAGVALSFRGGGGGERGVLLEMAEQQQQQQQVVVDNRNKETVVVVTTKNNEESFVVETQMFPIVMPRAFQLPATATAVHGLDISVASTAISSTTATTSSSLDKPPIHLLHAASQPLLPKQLVNGDNGFTGRELYHPETIEALAQTGLKIAVPSSPSSSSTSSEHVVRWVGERNTDKFLKDHQHLLPNAHHHHHHPHREEWSKALHSSQEVLVWVGKFSGSDGSKAMDEYYGAELPIIKTTSMIHRSPKYLAELLMDSNRVRLYNKMSLGRTDLQVLQTGV